MVDVSTAPSSLTPLQAVTPVPRRCRTRSWPTPRRTHISLWITLIEAVYNPPLTAANAFPMAEKGDDDRNRSHLGSGHDNKESPFCVSRLHRRSGLLVSPRSSRS